MDLFNIAAIVLSFNIMCGMRHEGVIPWKLWVENEHCVMEKGVINNCTQTGLLE